MESVFKYFPIQSVLHYLSVASKLMQSRFCSICQLDPHLRTPTFALFVSWIQPDAVRCLAQVWQNCRIFNAEGSSIWQVCQQAEDSFEANWSAARLPLTPRPPLPPSLAPKKPARSGIKRQRDAGMLCMLCNSSSKLSHISAPSSPSLARPTSQS